MNYHLYESGNIGMCNALMSVENALVLALLKNNSINFLHSGHLFNSEKKLTIFDLYDINYRVSHNQPYQIESKLHCDFHNTVIYKEKYPDEEFINGRINLINLNQYRDFGTYNSNTLSFYTYLFCLAKSEQWVIKDVRDRVKPKRIYYDIAMSIVKAIYPFNCINARRGDYLTIPGNMNSSVSAQDFLPVIDYHLDSKPLLIVSDETNKDYFKLVDNHYRTHYIQGFLPDHLDTAEKGLVALIVASHSAKFIGTLKSTFSAMIQRYRRDNGFQEDFIYLYTQHKDLVLNYGQFQQKEGLYPWSRIVMPEELKPITFWIRDF